jgi:hypothetical protein
MLMGLLAMEEQQQAKKYSYGNRSSREKSEAKIQGILMVPK